MGLVELINALEAEAEQELGRRRSAVEAEVERIGAAAAAEASEIIERAVVDARAAASVRAERQLLTTRARSAAQLRRAREDALDAVLEVVRTELDGMRDRPGWPSILDASLGEAVAALPAGQRVHVDPRDADVVRDLLSQAGRTVGIVADLSCAGGVVVAADGRRVDNTLESRLAAAWPRLRSALAASWEPT